MNRSIIIHALDSVGVALQPLQKGETAEGVVLIEPIEKGHKFARKAIPAGAPVIKYGEVIGTASRDIRAGEHVHTHNMVTALGGAQDYSYHHKRPALLPDAKSRNVMVYERSNGEVGIRNELWVIPTVGCVNAQAKAIVKAFLRKHPDCGGLDGCYTFTHPYGCSQIGEDHDRTRQILQKMVRHPNAGGVLVLGLGCENNRMDIFRETLGEYDQKRTAFLIAQEVVDEISEGVRILEQLCAHASSDKRVARDISCLKIGLKCGGSDGLSGITANPLVGRFSDYMAAVGGTTVLTEVPEMFGAEQLLMARAKDETVFGEIVQLVNGFKDYYQKHDQPVYENPSPGNKAGG
ncbi:MAG: UxaA family hydrolase, partial [Oscillospiraceae bacterium]|nr:UxaA family hydrolase [Oscillospiraceae bacterium]